MKLPLLLVLLALPLAAQAPEPGPVHRVAGGFEFLEGPAWWPTNHLLVFSDTPAGTVYGFHPGTGEQPGIYQKEMKAPSGTAFDGRAWLYICESRERRVVRRDPKGKIEVVAAEFEGKRLNSPNDVVVRKDGNVYFTDPAFGLADRQRELSFYGVYHVNTKNEIELVAKPKGRPNGVALSPDGEHLYVANSDERNVRVYDLDRRGSASRERVLVSGIEGVPDGLAVDSRGNLYVAARGIAIYSDDGKLLTKIDLEETPSNCTFGGDDLLSLFVTARTSLYEIRMNIKGSLQF